MPRRAPQVATRMARPPPRHKYVIVSSDMPRLPPRHKLPPPLCCTLCLSGCYGTSLFHLLRYLSLSPVLSLLPTVSLSPVYYAASLFHLSSPVLSTTFLPPIGLPPSSYGCVGWMRRMAEILRVERRSCNAGRLVPLGCCAACILRCLYLLRSLYLAPFVSRSSRARGVSCAVAPLLLVHLLVCLYLVHLSAAMTIFRLFSLVAMLASSEMLCKHLLFSPCLVLGLVPT